jgi:4-hydroxybenzoate polyprenyltransferase
LKKSFPHKKINLLLLAIVCLLTMLIAFNVFDLGILGAVYSLYLLPPILVHSVGAVAIEKTPKLNADASNWTLLTVGMIFIYAVPLMIIFGGNHAD